MFRLKILSGHLFPPSDHRAALCRSDCGSGTGAACNKEPEDVVVVHGLRSAICRAKRGSFKVTTV